MNVQEHSGLPRITPTGSDGKRPLLAAVFTAILLLTNTVCADTNPVDYFTAAFDMERVLDWGDRPDWSPDGRRIAFVESDQRESYAFELDLATQSVRCLTCQWGPKKGYFSRVYYLPDGSFLLTGGTPLAQMYWLPASLDTPPQPLDIDGVLGEVAIYRKTLASGNMLLAWGYGTTQGHIQLMTGELKLQDSAAKLLQRKVVYNFDPANPGASEITLSEAYSFTRAGKGILFATMERSTLATEMYEIDLGSGAFKNMSQSPWHTETHLIEGQRIGIVESNRASDPNGPMRGFSVHPLAIVPLMLSALGLTPPAGVELPTPEQVERGEANYHQSAFDLFVVNIDRPERLRRLTHVSDIGGEVDQKVPSPDGRRVAFTLAAPPQGPLAGKDGLYIGEFR